MSDFCLIGGIGRVPTGIFEDIALDDWGGDAVVIAHADKRTMYAVLGGNFFELGQGRIFALGCRQFERFFESNCWGYGFFDEGVEGRDTQYFQHLLDFLWTRTDMPLGELDGLLALFEKLSLTARACLGSLNGYHSFFFLSVNYGQARCLSYGDGQDAC